MTATGTSQPGRRLRLATIGGMLLLHVLALAAWTGTWITGRVQEAPLAVGGDAAAPALPALALCGLALAVSLSIAGPVFRAVLAVLQVLLGISIALSGVLVLSDPVSAAGPAVTARTGISGREGVAELLDAAAPTALPALAIALGIASAVLGVLLLITGRRWPARTRRFSAVRVETLGAETDGAETFRGGPVDEWDALSGGDDPTAEPGDRRHGG